jgi:predicted transcriptional regulator with HTH domain
VLKGMGDYVKLIQEGVVECARDETAKLYKENHTVDEMKDFLAEHGFEVLNQQSNDSWSNEFNLYFRKK